MDKAKSGRKEILSFFFFFYSGRETVAQTVSAVHLKLCEVSVASSELQSSECWEHPPSPFSRAEDSHAVDVTGRAVVSPWRAKLIGAL